MDWSLDRQLHRRMALILFALTALTVAFATGVAALLAWGFEWLGLGTSFETRLLLGGVVTLVAGIVMLWWTLGKDAAETFDAEPIGPEEHPALHATVTRLAHAADLPVPSVHITDRDRPLAMTTGLTTDDTKLVVSTGLLDLLDADALEAVVAHEIAHIKNRDAAVMTLVELPLASARHFGQLFRGGGGQPVLLGVGLASYVFWGVGRLLVASLSRWRELAADRGASALLGDPAPLADALAMLDNDVPAAPDRDARVAALASLSIVPDSEGPGPKLSYQGHKPFLWGARLPVRRLHRRLLSPALATHPATDERIDRLRRVERENTMR